MDLEETEARIVVLAKASSNLTDQQTIKVSQSVERESAGRQSVEK
jgi:hypothetical protein